MMGESVTSWSAPLNNEVAFDEAQTFNASGIDITYGNASKSPVNTLPTLPSNIITFNSSSNVSDQLQVPEGCVVLRVSEFVPWDNPDNLISQEVEQMFDMIVAVVFLNILFLISAPTNILSMVVFTKHGLKERINMCLFFQSLADIIYMTINMFLYADRIYLEVSGVSRRGPLFQFTMNNHLLGLYGFSSASGFMTMVIACERCFCVVSPLRSQHVLKTKSTLVIILVAFVCIVGGFFVVVTRWHITCIFDPRTNSTSPEIYPSKFYLLNKKLIDALDGFVYGIALPGTFTLVVIVCTIVTVVKLAKLASWREQSSSAAMVMRDVALTRMLIGCSILFIVCTIPGVVFRVSILFVPDISLRGRHYNTFTFMTSVTELFGYINASCNFFIYYTIGSKFRATIHTICRRKRKAKRHNTQNLHKSDIVCTA